MRDLFGSDPRAGASGRDPAAASERAPLAARMRPRTLDEFRGQARVVGPGGPIRTMIDAGRATSFILWGPPGSGKTTLARLASESVAAAFVAFSAVTQGVARVRAIVKEAQARRRATGVDTILFCDEIHRFNKAQQDAFLPFVEDGTVTLIGATTENPSFHVVRPLLSRAPVIVLEALASDELAEILEDAATDRERGLGARDLVVEREAIERIALLSDGDARRALGILERAAQPLEAGSAVTLRGIEVAAQRRFAVYDRAGDQRYDHVSALHKSVRGSDPDAALYWLARMLEAGEDPMYVARRLIRMAIEDVGLAEPAALGAALAARDACRHLGSPEGELALAQAAVFLAGSRKSNRVYEAWKRARERARRTPGAAVPLHLRNAPTRLAKDLGHGDGYLYDPDQPEGVAPQSHLPSEVEGERFYDPGDEGWEAESGPRLARWRKIREG